MLEVVIDAVVDSVKLLPFLFIAYLIMEYIEHKTKEHAKETIRKSGNLGPLIGGIVGVFPQCGFSASATNLYAGRVISLGTLIAVYLSTSDEMLPILISESVSIGIIAKILAIKMIIGICAGFIIDFIIRLTNKEKKTEHIKEFCEHQSCNCNNDGILKSSLKHTLNIFVYIFVITLLINCLMFFIGEDRVGEFIGNYKFLGPVVASLVGLIPNCAASVIITNLYLGGIINAASLIAGLLTGAGVGLIVLFKVNDNLKENFTILALIYGIGVISGIVLELIGFSI